MIKWMILAVLTTGGLAQEPDHGNLTAPAMCIAALQYPGVADQETELAAQRISNWRRVMQAINADATAHQAAIDDARRSFDRSETSKAGLGVLAARGMAAVCSSDELPSRYVARFASAESAAQYQRESDDD